MVVFLSLVRSQYSSGTVVSHDRVALSIDFQVCHPAEIHAAVNQKGHSPCHPISPS